MASIILLVDDDDSARRAAQKVLGHAGYEVVVAKNGAEGFRLLEEGLRPAVILLDLLMADGNGWQFRRRQSAHPSFSRIPVVIVSGLDDPPGLGGAAAFVRKPFEVDDLLSAIRKCTETSAG